MKKFILILICSMTAVGCSTNQKRRFSPEQAKAERALQEIASDHCNGRCQVNSCTASKDHGLYCRVDYFMVTDSEKEASSRLFEKALEKQGHEVVVAGTDSAGSIWALVVISVFLAALIA